MEANKQQLELMKQQGENILKSMNELKRRAKKKGKERFDLYEKFSANRHSFTIYTYMDSRIQQEENVQDFQQKLDLFDNEFDEARINFEADLDFKAIESAYQDVITAFNEMAAVLEF
ncbi:hypothetical protein [Neobacillus mesonae]|uniref:hypothetical protein n=1 Tax=Neobacillus mesonae TaxID=1193713 RepID=UPI00203F1307|nr:hypothetical protein [Neobacillus mesonae]MCM3567712.1 hypothetical protein [Neobacillus mesonae]